MKIIYTFIALSLCLACQDYNDDIFEIAGVYQANIIGETGTFEMPISVDFGDNITIEAPFDGEVWDIVTADIDCTDCEIKDIDIEPQRLDNEVFIEGTGAYSYGTIQLDYVMEIFGDEFYFTLVASK